MTGRSLSEKTVVALPPCSRCNSTGRIPYTNDILDAEGEVVGSESGSHVCLCVRDLPAIDGEAITWSVEPIHEKVWTNSIYPDNAVEIKVDVEVPRDKRGRRLHRTQENFYYPTMIDVELPSRLLMHPDMARDLAAALVAAAEVCEKADDL